MNEELTNRIVKDVLSALGEGPAGGAPGATAAPFAAVGNPPAASPRAAPDDSAPRTTKVFVTAQMLRQRVNGGEGARIVELAWNEVLTPNALDYVQQMRLDVRTNARADPESASPATDPAKAQNASREPEVASVRAKTQANAEPPESRSGRSIGLVVSRPDGKVSAVLASLEREGIALVPFAQTDCPVRNLTALCEAIASGRVAGGIVIAPHAAGVMALAGKSKGVRPVQATRSASVQAGLRQFAANLLVVEHAFSTLHEIRAMVRLFAAGPGAPPTDLALMAALGRLDGA